MLTHALSPTEVQALVRLIGKAPGHTGWPTKKDLVLAIPTGGGWVTSADVAEAVGLGEGTCRRLLQQLEADRVILRDGGTGGRRLWVEVNPDWERWRVPWRVPVRTVREKLALARETAAQTPWERFIARPRHARYPRIIDLLGARDRDAQEAAEAERARAHRPRDNGGARADYRAGSPARAGGSGSRAHGPRAKSAPPTGGGDLSLARRENPPPAVDPVQLARARSAVYARVMPDKPGEPPWIDGGPADRLAELVARYGIDDVVAAAAKVDAGVHKPPRFVNRMADVLAGAVDGPAPAVAQPDPAVLERQRAERELGHLRTQLGALINLGATEAETAELRARIQHFEAQTEAYDQPA